MSVTDGILKTDYSKTFDDKRKALVCQSYYKYGKASKNFSTGNVDALGCIEKCLEKFKETKNTEYLLDLANYKKTMSMIADSITKNSSGLGISEEQLEDAVARGVAMAMMNNKPDIKVQCVAEFKTTDEALARAVSRGQQKIEYRMKPVPSY